MTLGILGGGQLGMLLAEAAKSLKIKTVVLDAAADCPAKKTANRLITAPVTDEKAAVELARACDVVTLEWELIPASLLAKVEAVKPLHPSSTELAIIQDRLKQKEFLAKHGIAQAPFAAPGRAGVKLPARLKKRGGGYDGKGQWRITSPNDPALTAEKDCVLEEEVRFDREVSVILARTAKGEVKFFPPAENQHRNGILHLTSAPAKIPLEGFETARKIAERLGHVGVLTVEFFQVGNLLLVNEIAPRVHNSGHWTLGGCSISQFEQHVRAVCGLPLLEPQTQRAAVMVNLLGDLWAKGEPDFKKLEREPDVKLWLYGKSAAKPGRKMGHFVVYDGGPQRAEKLLAAL